MSLEVSWRGTGAARADLAVASAVGSVAIGVVFPSVLDGPDATARLDVRCVGVGSETLVVRASDESGVLAEEAVTIECLPCEDGGRPDAGSTPSERPAERFSGALLMDRRDDHVDSPGGSPAYTGADADVAAMGSEVEMQSRADADTDFNNSTYECGETSGAMFTVCTPGVLPMPEGELSTFVLEVGAPVPVADPMWSYVYALVLDSNGDASDDYVPDPAFPFDYFRGTDRWYELRWDHTTSEWSLVVTQLDGSGARTSVQSTARVVVEGPRITFFVSRSELPAVVAGYRVSAFRHDGAFGVATRGWRHVADAGAAALAGGLRVPRRGVSRRRAGPGSGGRAGELRVGARLRAGDRERDLQRDVHADGGDALRAGRGQLRGGADLRAALGGAGRPLPRRGAARLPLRHRVGPSDLRRLRHALSRYRSRRISTRRPGPSATTAFRLGRSRCSSGSP